MKAQLRSDLLDEKILDLVGYDEDGEPKIYFLQSPESPKGAYIEYEIYDVQEAYHDENTEKALTHYIQVSIFSPGDYTSIERVVRETLKGKGYDGGYGPDLYEEKTKLNHKPLRFTYTEILEE